MFIYKSCKNKEEEEATQVKINLFFLIVNGMELIVNLRGPVMLEGSRKDVWYFC